MIGIFKVPSGMVVRRIAQRSVGAKSVPAFIARPSAVT
jgi:hypothetical protein